MVDISLNKSSVVSAKSIILDKTLVFQILFKTKLDISTPYFNWRVGIFVHATF